MNCQRFVDLMVRIAVIVISVTIMAPSLGDAAPGSSPWPQPSVFFPGSQPYGPTSTGTDATECNHKTEMAEAVIEDSGSGAREIGARTAQKKITILSSNPAWAWKSPVPPAENISQGFFPNDNEGWLVSLSQGLLYTRDGGQTWAANRFGPPLGFYDVFFSDSQHGWAVGRSSDAWDFNNTSIIWSTVNGGKTWTQQYSEPDTKGFGVVQFIDNQTGWVIATKEMLKTTDGGQTWQALALPGEIEGYELTDFVFLDPLNGWLLAVKQNAQESANLALHTADGGATWVVETIPVPLGGSLFHLSFADPDNGWACGLSGAIWQRKSSGEWTQQNNPYNTADVAGIKFFDYWEGWAAFKNGFILHTVDGGVTWVLNAVIPQFNLTGLAFSDRYHGWVYGPFGVVYRTVDGGMTWQNMRQGPTNVLLSASFVSATTGWVTGTEGKILRTKDGGATWTAQTSYVSTTLNSIDFVNTSRGWAVGEGGRIIGTVDGGAHWSPQVSGVNTNLASVAFVNSKAGWAVGDGGVILTTANGGATWTFQDAKTTLNLRKVQFKDAKHGWALGNGGKGGIPAVLRTEDGGKTWSAVEVMFHPNQEAGTLLGMHFLNSREGWICGFYEYGEPISRVAHTTDGGKTWVIQEDYGSGTPIQVFTTMWFTDKKHGYVAGEYGLLYTTSNGGQQWTPQVRPCPGVEPVQDITFVNSKTGFMVGGGGAILKTATGGVLNK